MKFEGAKVGREWDRGDRGSDDEAPVALTALESAASYRRDWARGQELLGRRISESEPIRLRWLNRCPPLDANRTPIPPSTSRNI